MKAVKISVDDLRAIPNGFDHLFLNPEEFIDWRYDNPKVPIKLLTLDHDMGLNYMDGYDLVKELVHNSDLHVELIDRIQFHTDNMIGLANMYHYLVSAQNADVIPYEMKIIKEKMTLIDGRLSFSGYSPIH